MVNETKSDFLSGRYNERSLFNSVCFSGLSTEFIQDAENTVLVRRFFLLNIFSILGVLSWFIFGLVYYLHYAQFTFAYLCLVFAFVTLANMAILRLTKRVNNASFVFTLVIIIYLVFVLKTGGIEGSGILWWYIFPYGTFMLWGRRGGLFWSSISFIILFIFFVLSAVGLITLPYSLVFMRQAMSVLLVVSAISFFSNKELEREREMVAKSTDDMSSANKKLSVDVGLRHLAEKTLEDRATELESINKFMVGRELKMSELKKENEELKRQIAANIK